MTDRTEVKKLGEHPEREAFHAAIWQRPDDDLPRLVYADWLDERNEYDAAAFLRLLCAVRTCPPDVDRLRPLVADFRRAMAKVPPSWVEEVCPIPPAVVVGPWVDVDHEANREVLELIRQRRRSRSGVQPPGELIHVRPEQEVRWPSRWVVDRLWGELQEALSPAAACAIDGVPALVDVWSGVVMAVASGESDYLVRGPDESYMLRTDLNRSPNRFDPDRHRLESHIRNALGLRWLVGAGWLEMHEEGLLSAAAAEFDPANQP
jgi:uncharacterized protein (TIGR02996 family)